MGSDIDRLSTGWRPLVLGPAGLSTTGDGPTSLQVGALDVRLLIVVRVTSSRPGRQVMGHAVGPNGSVIGIDPEAS